MPARGSATRRRAPQYRLSQLFGTRGAHEPELLDRVVAQRRAHAQEWLAASVPAELEATVAVTEGDEATVVVATASRNAVDLIVADAATARAIAHEAPCPVLAVPAGRT